MSVVVQKIYAKKPRSFCRILNHAYPVSPQSISLNISASLQGATTFLYTALRTPLFIAKALLGGKPDRHVLN